MLQAILAPAGNGFDATVPELPECKAEGESVADAVSNVAAQVMKRLRDANAPAFSETPAVDEVPEGCQEVFLCIYGERKLRVRRKGKQSQGKEPSGDAHAYDNCPTVSSLPADADVVSAAEASRILGVTPGRISQLLAAGMLDGYRQGRHTFVTRDSIDVRLDTGSRPGRPARSEF